MTNNNNQKVTIEKTPMYMTTSKLKFMDKVVRPETWVPLETSKLYVETYNIQFTYVRSTKQGTSTIGRPTTTINEKFVFNLATGPKLTIVVGATPAELDEAFIPGACLDTLDSSSAITRSWISANGGAGMELGSVQGWDRAGSDHFPVKVSDLRRMFTSNNDRYYYNGESRVFTCFADIDTPTQNKEHLYYKSGENGTARLLPCFSYYTFEEYVFGSDIWEDQPSSVDMGPAPYIQWNPLDYSPSCRFSQDELTPSGSLLNNSAALSKIPINFSFHTKETPWELDSDALAYYSPDRKFITKP